MKNAALFNYTLALLALCICTQHLTASPITANVVGSSVGKSQLVGAEYRNGYEWDDDNSSQDNRYTDRIDLFYNVTNMTQLRAFFNRVNPGDGDSDITNMFIEPAFQIFEKDKDGFDGAFTTGLTLAEGDNVPHQIRTLLTGTIPISDAYFVHNSIFAHQFGADSVSGLRYEARWRLMQPVKVFGRTVDMGVEMFNDFENLRTASGFDAMTHRAGPVMTGNITSRLGFQAGVLAGLSSEAPDLGCKFWLNYQY